MVETENALVLVIDIHCNRFALDFGYLAAHFARERLG